MSAKLHQSCPTLCDPMGHSLPGSSDHGILQARILEWVASLLQDWRLLEFKTNEGYLCHFRDSRVL